ncbi:MAG: GatB/YqeY domain-containing protein, partial [Bacillota bacterium]|nr:GatB/YqeY domain-containing protein [Bacillota bacterium]
ALADFESAGRTDLVEAYNAEIEVLTEYLPKQLTADEIADIVKQTAADLGIETGSGRASMGKLMGATMPKVKGVADGNQVKVAVEQFLA